jgi:hypothetical protein
MVKKYSTLGRIVIKNFGNQKLEMLGFQNKEIKMHILSYSKVLKSKYVFTVLSDLLSNTHNSLRLGVQTKSKRYQLPKRNLQQNRA